MTKGTYGGTFDPLTLGHLDIIEQGLQVFDKIVVAMGVNPAKPNRYFDLPTSMRLIMESCEEAKLPLERILVTSFTGSLVRFAEAIDSTALIRGLRQISDFDAEFRLNGINAIVSRMPQVYMICHTEYLHVSSSTVKEMHSLGLPINKFVTPCVIEAFGK